MHARGILSPRKLVVWLALPRRPDLEPIPRRVIDWLHKARDMRRRKFLIRSCEGAAAWLVRAHPLAAQVPRAPSEFHFHPRYRAATPLDAVRLKGDAANDDFPSEKQHDRIAAILASWKAALLESPDDIRLDRQGAGARFPGTPPQPVESHTVRAGPALEIRRISFASEPSLGAEAFLQQLLSAWSLTRTQLPPSFTSDPNRRRPRPHRDSRPI